MTTGSEIQERIDQFPQLCRKNGLKVTPQRVAIFEMLARAETHPTPEEVFAEVRRHTPSISLATVYKILELFQDRGFVNRVSTRGQVSRYDARVGNHHHVVCTRCGAIADVSPGEFGDHAVQFPALPGFQVFGYEIQFQGLCKCCTAQA